MTTRSIPSRRAPRIECSFSVVFRTETEILRGCCLNLSESGLLAVLPATALGSEGELRLQTGVLCLAQRARVRRLESGHVGFSFVFQHPMEREAIQELFCLAKEELARRQYSGLWQPGMFPVPEPSAPRTLLP